MNCILNLCPLQSLKVRYINVSTKLEMTQTTEEQGHYGICKMTKLNRSQVALLQQKSQLTVSPAVDTAIDSQCKGVTVGTLRRRNAPESAALVEGETTWKRLAAGSAKTKTSVAALTARADSAISVNHKRTVLPGFHLKWPANHPIKLGKHLQQFLHRAGFPRCEKS